MQRKIITTNDGSHSIEIAATNETYHSRFGAIQESKHVFIQAGLKPLLQKLPVINIFEMGFGTGLNALLTFIEAKDNQQKIYYETIEEFPLEQNFISQLNYCEQLQKPGLQEIFYRLHSCEWNKEVVINSNFSFKKINKNLIDYEIENHFDVIYFDAFAPDSQPELWSKKIFAKLFSSLSDNGLLTTYCSKGEVRRILQDIGFIVKKLKGPPGKREMLLATKTDKRDNMAKVVN